MPTTRRPSLAARAKALAEKASSAYSYDRYGSWAAVAKLLLSQGFTEREAEAIMRSKWMRWAADNSTAAYGKVPAAAIRDFLKNSFRGDPAKLKAEVAALVGGTFPS